MKKNAIPAGRQGFAPLIIILTIAILGAVGYFAYKNAQKIAQSLALTPNLYVDTSSWIPITRRDLTLKYPTSWIGIGEDGNVISFGPSDNIYFSVGLSYSPQQKSLDLLTSDAQKPENNGSSDANGWNSSVANKSFDGYPGEVVTNTVNGNLYDIEAIINFNNITYTISSYDFITPKSNNMKYKDQFMQILNTVMLKK